jgi:hypothetical protein
MMMGGFMYLLSDSMAYKVYQNDVENVEREMEKPVRELSEEELVAAMKLLGIQRLEITSADKETISKLGKPVKALSKNDLLAAMKRQGIKKLELMPEDKGAMPHSETSEARYCMYCGNNLLSDAVYCERCGRKIERAR